MDTLVLGKRRTPPGGTPRASKRRRRAPLVRASFAAAAPPVPSGSDSDSDSLSSSSGGERRSRQRSPAIPPTKGLLHLIANAESTDMLPSDERSSDGGVSSGSEYSSSGSGSRRGRTPPSAYGRSPSPGSSAWSSDGESVSMSGSESSGSVRRPSPPPPMPAIDPMALQMAEDRERAQLLGEYDVGKMSNPQLFTRNFTHDCDIRELRTEVGRVRYLERRSTAINIGRKVVLLALSVLEWGNRKYSPWKLSIDGLKDHSERRIHEADSCIARLWLKYTGGQGQMSPEFELLSIVAGWVFMYHITHSLCQNDFMQPAQVQRIVQNNDVMGSIIDQMADSADEKYQAGGSISQMTRDAGGAPPVSAPSDTGAPGGMGGLGGLMNGLFSGSGGLGGIMQNVMSQFNNQMGSFDPQAPAAPAPTPTAAPRARPRSVPPPPPSTVFEVPSPAATDTEDYTSGADEDVGVDFGDAYENRIRTPAAEYDAPPPPPAATDQALLQRNAHLLEMSPSPSTPTTSPRAAPESPAPRAAQRIGSRKLVL